MPQRRWKHEGPNSNSRAEYSTMSFKLQTTLFCRGSVKANHARLLPGWPQTIEPCSSSRPVSSWICKQRDWELILDSSRNTKCNQVPSTV